jgi:predicted nucleic acid-binding protein
VKGVADAGPLIALGKLGLVHLLHAQYDQVLAPSTVYVEVVTRGLEQGQPDAYVVQLAVAREELRVIQVQESDLSESIRSLPLHRRETRHPIGFKRSCRLGIA